ncbi:MAG: FtsX-like permease family protein [Candidatus Omnitrophica bacterium]|nr:FtsX-like permease family protein [Candidatus Omnitrophota bacterium]
MSRNAKNVFFFFVLVFLTNQLYSQQVTSFIRDISSVSSRLPGTPGHRLTADLVESAFRSAGLAKIHREPFTTVVPADKGAFLEAGNKKIPLYGVWPNLVRTPTLPPAGICGPLLYGGKGNLKTFSGKPMRGSIAVYDFDCGSRWLDSAMLGARAVIFLESDRVTRLEAKKKFLSIPVSIPRFYATGQAAREILQLCAKQASGRLFSRMDWQQVRDENVCGVLIGRDPKLRDDLIILHAYYDSTSVVPSLSPGADSSCGLATLLSLVHHFRQNPPKRTIMFLATSSHFQYLRGMDAFIQAHLRTTEPFKNKIAKEQRLKPLLLIGLDLSSGSNRLGIWHNSYEFSYQRFFAPLGKKFIEYAARAASQLGLPGQDSLANGVSPEKGILWQTFLPDVLRTDGEMAVFAGIPAVTFLTVNDGRWYLDTPVDTFDRVNTANIEQQAALLIRILDQAVNDPQLMPETKLELKDNLYSLIARLTTFDPRKSFVPDQPVEGALALPRLYDNIRGWEVWMGVRPPLLMTDKAGTVEFTSLFRNASVWLQGFKLNPETGQIVMAPDMGVNGHQQYPITLKMDYKEKKWMIVLFDCEPVDLFSLVDPQYLTQLSKIDVFDTSNSLPDAYGYYLQYPEFIPWSWTSCSELAGVAFAKPASRIKITGESGPLGKRLLLLNAEEKAVKKEQAEGIGFLTSETPAILDTPYQAARDMIILDSYRTRSFEGFGIRNERLKELQRKAKSLLEMAEEAREKMDWFSFVKFSRQSQAIESRAYPDVKSTANDVVKGIIFYFILLLPFAYFAERLIFGFPKIEQRIAGVFGIFLAIYWIMRLVHPAFKLTNAPEVILLSFIVLALSFIVLSIVASKFEEQMQRMKQETSGVYQTDVGRITAAGTAFSLGVANMKRRKMRTILTSITLILLTFTVLSFTSIKSYLHFNRLQWSVRPPYSGILLRDRAWAPLQEVALDYVRSEFSETGLIAPRAWFVLRELGNRTAIDISHRGKSVLATGLLGIAPEEKEVSHLDQCLTAGHWIEQETDACLLPESMAASLGITRENVGQAKIRIYGRELVVKGLFNEKKLNDLRELDNEPITPVDFSVMPEKEISKIKMERTAQVYSGDVKLQGFVHMEAENVVIVDFETLMDMGGTLHALAVRFPEGSNVQKLVEDFISKLAVILFVGAENKTYVYSSMGLTSFSGIGNLIIPILIAALIVLNTMLGSVYERIKEIGTYSAVGLAPVHIASLFLAESLVYAVLGAVTGYLLGQVIARVLMVTGLLQGLVLNYSSLSAVMATVIIVITVLLSTIYPARKASRMAVPDVTRRWVLPEPKGDLWQFEFPFTVSEVEVLGLASFLTEYFGSYQDVSLGNFYTNGAQLKAEKNEIGKSVYTITTSVWLAPFDLGVSQKLTVVMKPLGQYNFYTIDVNIERTSGESTDWKRLNRRFLDGIRKQFLIWRTVSPEVKKTYAEQGRLALAKA